MDRFGRLWTAVPSMLGLGLGHLVLAVHPRLCPPTSRGSSSSRCFCRSRTGSAAGILMTLGADLADPPNPAPFLGAWRFTNDFGGAVAPLLVAGITAVASLALAVGRDGRARAGGAS